MWMRLADVVVVVRCDDTSRQLVVQPKCPAQTLGFPARVRKMAGQITPVAGFRAHVVAERSSPARRWQAIQFIGRVTCPSPDDSIAARSARQHEPHTGANIAVIHALPATVFVVPHRDREAALPEKGLASRSSSRRLHRASLASGGISQFISYGSALSRPSRFRSTVARNPRPSVALIHVVGHGKRGVNRFLRIQSSCAVVHKPGPMSCTSSTISDNRCSIGRSARAT